MYTLASLTLERASKMPDHRFLFDDTYTNGISYAEFNELSGKVYAFLKTHGIGKDDFVLINLTRGANQFIAMAGVTKAGAAFTVTEQALGEKRIEFIRKDCNCKIEINQKIWDEIMKIKALSGCEEVSPHDAAYAIYTSGSTGKPKGVLHEYGNMDFGLNTFPDNGSIAFNSYDRFANVFPLFTAAGIYDCFWTFGITNRTDRFYMVPNNIIKNPDFLYAYFKENHISSMTITPSFARIIADKIIHMMRVMVLGGENTDNIYFEYEGFTLLNCYSNSEIGYPLTLFKLKQSYTRCPVGKADHKKVKIHILDENDNELPNGKVGEICVDYYYTRGYINLYKETKNVFRGNLVHTGDAGHIDENGDLVIHGRLDELVKINGFRVEPAEIKSAICSELKLKWAEVKVFSDNSSSYIVAYYTEDIDIDADKIKKQLRRMLPEYMIPEFFIKINKIPRLRSGKVDKNALPKPRRESLLGEYVPPENEFQKTLCEKMAKVLKLERIGINDDFFVLGGSSLSAIAVLSECGIPSLSIKELYAGRTPKEIWKIYEKGDNQGNENVTAAIDEKNMKSKECDHPLTIDQNDLLEYQCLFPESTEYNLYTLLRFPLKTDVDRLKEAIEKVLGAHPVFSTIICYNENNELVQRYIPNMDFSLEVENTTEEKFAETIKTLIVPFTGINEKLYRTNLFRTEAYIYLFIDIYHAIGDGTSLQIFFSDLSKAYDNKPLDTDYYYLKLIDKENEKKSEFYKKGKIYYAELFDKYEWDDCITKDHEANKFSYDVITKMIPVKQKTYYELLHNYGISKNAYFIMLSLISISCYNNSKNIRINWTHNGRENFLDNNIIGALLKFYYIGICFEESLTIKQFYTNVLEQIKNNIIYTAYPYQGSDTDYDDSSDGYTLDEIAFATGSETNVYYQHSLYDIVPEGDLKFESVAIERQNKNASNLMNIEIRDTQDGCKMYIEYIRECYDKASIEHFCNIYLRISELIAQHISNPEYKISSLKEEINSD